MAKQFNFNRLRGILDVWLSGQTQLPKVIRWKKYITEGKGARRQDSLQHTYSIEIFGRIMVVMLRPFGALDENLLITAFTAHDHGEGELERDILWQNKNNGHDLEEYLAFRRRYQKLPPVVFEEFERAFLLQFALANPPDFPEPARRIMAELAKTKTKEAVAFEAIEKADYFLFALEQYLTRDNAPLFARVISNHSNLFDELTKTLPGWKESFWTPALRAWCLKFVEETGNATAQN